MRIAYTTLGCKVNQYDTQAMRELLENAGHTSVPFDEVADVYLINTCSVTQTGEKKSRQMISRAHALSPQAKIIVAGCYAQRAPQEVLLLPGVDLAVGTKDRSRIVDFVKMLDTDGGVNAVGPLRQETAFEEMTVTREGRTRAHMKIQEGCDRFCTYCIIPYTRGPLRSRTLTDIRKQMELLEAANYKEIVLTGIHLMSYGKDLSADVTLLDAIRQAEGLDGIRRIRLGSLEPQLLNEAYVAELAGNDRICRQFHLSLQSGSAGVLQRMHRRYTPDVYKRCVQLLRGAMPDCAITTDIIVGFPGETEREFQETMDFAREIGFARIHVFPYSRREGTIASAMPGQLSRSEKTKRASALIVLAEEMEKAYASRMIGSVQDVLFEECIDGEWQGYTDTYVHVRVGGAHDELAGRILPVAITGMQDLHLVGALRDEA
ncbi:MAG: tRNA (N(6)-L-threonylcarbamoyladenosine(37)-C(2))-methylthiotransferase MtaB [Clostridia bacterium]|nr:tRNA (N(6)-L-threonylcarbamoyladenosine(37)-C(2))-methylthiotransferase MtaB [Clostridia bacterium]